ncbi:7-cyano-7-deazaguanine reductase [Lentzea aerocolonigenes]|uniref:7-carboxy-7-deazaguanine synthase n=1 Tax=Lentzea aerocolonigenes TaxID=68170 RepID=A0A0F0H9P8_LENAE|nr:7-carboxy-7-deazaguanine synthase [Lentzea aerocolonigenes]KJK50363.1 7-cyano-7-deazaguanine reductase [Lentzea aerocolonigenes]
MTYFVKEIFYTLQGEGRHAGRPAVFCRFSRCNLWTGLEKDRHRAVCQFCDTDFVGADGINGGKFTTAEELANAVANVWEGDTDEERFVVCTGGEPLLQLDIAAIDALHDRGFEISVETNGTQVPPPGIDWLCVSPKLGSTLVATSGHELKLVFPQVDGEPERFEHLRFESFRLQPMDGPDVAANTAAAIAYCKRNPKWSLSVQTHKYLGIA